MGEGYVSLNALRMKSKSDVHSIPFLLRVRYQIRSALLVMLMVPNIISCGGGLRDSHRQLLSLDVGGRSPNGNQLGIVVTAVRLDVVQLGGYWRVAWDSAFVYPLIVGK